MFILHNCRIGVLLYRDICDFTVVLKMLRNRSDIKMVRRDIPHDQAAKRSFIDYFLTKQPLTYSTKDGSSDALSATELRWETLFP